jgi:hypothetical protein
MGLDNLVNYKNGDFKDLKQTIDMCLDKKMYREFYRYQLHNEVRKYHTYTNRASEMLNIIFKEKSP